MFCNFDVFALRFIVTGRILRLINGSVAVFLAALFVAVFVPWLKDFCRELKFINMEIQRNTGRERQHWEKKKRRLLWSICPFIRYKG